MYLWHAIQSPLRAPACSLSSFFSVLYRAFVIHKELPKRVLGSLSAYLYTHMYTHTCTDAYMYMYICIRIHAQTHICTCTFCTCVCILYTCIDLSASVSLTVIVSVLSTVNPKRNTDPIKRKWHNIEFVPPNLFKIAEHNNLHHRSLGF